jgi:hypothetical protein
MQKLGNTSSAVMQQRQEAADSLDDFPTPPWSPRACIGEILRPRGVDLAGKTALEPACNRGYLARPLTESFGRVVCTDIADYGWTGQHAVIDFFAPGFRQELSALAPEGVDWIITNPPFNRGAEFVLRALELAREGVAIIARSAFLEGDERHRELFAPRMPWIVAQHAERVPMVRGRFDPDASTATSYSWFIWRRDWVADHYIGTWIPKCRDRYARPDDVNFEMKDGKHADFIAKAIADSPLFAHAGEG